jgi:hypothetical protein
VYNRVLSVGSALLRLGVERGEGVGIEPQPQPQPYNPNPITLTPTLTPPLTRRGRGHPVR